MKLLGLFLALAVFPAVVFAQSAQTTDLKPIGAVLLRPLTPSTGDEDFAALVANAGAATLNLDNILLVLDSPDRHDPADVTEANKYLASRSAQAKTLIAQADVALARSDLPGTVQKPLAYFPRISVIEQGAPRADERDLASARAEVLACQATLLNLRMAANPKPVDTSEQANFEEYLEQARAHLKQAEAAAK